MCKGCLVMSLCNVLKKDVYEHLLNLDNEHIFLYCLNNIDALNYFSVTSLEYDDLRGFLKIYPSEHSELLLHNNKNFITDKDLTKYISKQQNDIFNRHNNLTKDLPIELYKTLTKCHNQDNDDYTLYQDSYNNIYKTFCMNLI